MIVERTLFTLEWLQSPELSRRVQVGLNKGEAKNALARAAFFNRLGELRDRTSENQRYRASGLNLAVAAIVPSGMSLALLALRGECSCRRPPKLPCAQPRPPGRPSP